MRSLVELAFLKHKDWMNIVKSFGCNPSLAEDVVQEMYIQIHLDIHKGLDISYKGDINHYYCYKVLRGIYLNIHKKEAKKIKIYLDQTKEIKHTEETGIDEVEYAQNKEKVDNILSELYWYDRKVFEIIASGKSVASLSRDTSISYISLYNTYRTTKKFIKDQL
tara:strand:- start:9010 stop:9501 length:492 start_codon:yes stop_codon:yes gene_type:complete